MKKRNSNKVSPLVWVISTMLILPMIVFVSPIFARSMAAPNAEIVGSIPDQTNTQGDAVSLDLDFTDAATITASPLPTGLSINSSTGIITGNPSAVEVVNNIAVEARNITGTLLISDTFNWTVVAANNDPVITNAPNSLISAQDQNIDFQFLATDSNDDPLTFSAPNGLPNGVNLSSDGLMTGSTNSVQTKSVTIKVVDNNGGEDEETFTWEVKNGTNVGNEAASQTGDRVDGWPSNMVINLSEDFTNHTNSSLTVYVTGFSFNAENADTPITPFVVKVAADKDPSDLDFEVVAVGSTRSTYDAGSNYFIFKDGGKTVTLQPDETLLPGFIDAQANGNGGTGSTVTLIDTDDEVWYSGGPTTSNDGFAVSEGQAPEPRLYKNDQGDTLEYIQIFRRSYAFNIDFGTNSPYITPTPSMTPTTEPADYQIKNGSFENDSVGNNKTSLVDWEVLEGAVDVTNSLSTDGDQSIDLNTATISQTVDGLDIGTKYILRVDYQGNDGQSGAGTMADASVIIDDESLSMWWRDDIPGSVPQGIHTVNNEADWTLCHGFVFEAITTKAVIKIDSLETGASDGLRIDNVRIEEYAAVDMTEFTHNIGDLDALEDGWLQLASGDFEFRNSNNINELPPYQSDPQNSGDDQNPHLCGIGTEESGLDDWFIPRETVDLIKGSGFALPPGSTSGNWILDLGGEGPGAMVQKLTGLTPNSTYYLRFYAARHTQYGTDDMTSELWINEQQNTIITRTSDQTGDNGYILEFVEVQSDGSGDLLIELFSTTEDQGGSIVFDNFSIIAQEDLPSFTIPASELLNNVGEEISIELPLDDTITGTLKFDDNGTLPTGLSIGESTGMISGTLTTAGMFDVVITLTAEGNDSFPGASANIDWLVNTIPEITAIADQSNSEGDSAGILIMASDADGNELTYAVSGLPDGMIFDPASKQITGTITAAGGQFSVTVGIDDNFGGLASTSFNWDVNAKPVIDKDNSVADTLSNQLNDNVALNVPVEDSDTDVSEITFSATGLPGSLTINESTGLISGTITESGSFEVVVTADDNEGGVSSMTFNWEINAPPVFDTDPGTQTGERGGTVNLSAAASDADGDTLTYSATDLPRGLSIDSATGLISGTLFSGGQDTSIITVTDGNGGETTMMIFWDISGPVVPASGSFTISLPSIIR